MYRMPAIIGEISDQQRNSPPKTLTSLATGLAGVDKLPDYFGVIRKTLTNITNFRFHIYVLKKSI